MGNRDQLDELNDDDEEDSEEASLVTESLNSPDPKTLATHQSTLSEHKPLIPKPSPPRQGNHGRNDIFNINIANMEMPD